VKILSKKFSAEKEIHKIYPISLKFDRIKIHAVWHGLLTEIHLSKKSAQKNPPWTRVARWLLFKPKIPI
jgi:hypothetical protein